MRVVNKRSGLGASVFSVEDRVGHLQGEGGGDGGGGGSGHSWVGVNSRGCL